MILLILLLIIVVGGIILTIYIPLQQEKMGNIVQYTLTSTIRPYVVGSLGRSYKEILEDFLFKARNWYRLEKDNPLPGMKEAVYLDEQARYFLFNAKVINESYVVVNDSLYRYVILRYQGLADKLESEKVTLCPNVHVERIHENINVTTTGGRCWLCRINIGDKSHMIRICEIPFVIGLYKLYGDVIHVNDTMFVVRLYIVYTSPNDWESLWLLLNEVE